MQGRPETTITIANWAGVNMGDDAIFSSLLSALRSNIPGKLRVFVLSDNEKEIARKYKIDGVAPIFEYYRPENLPRVLGFLRRSDLVIYGGGDLLNGDLTSLSFLRMAKLLGVPVVCCGVGVLPVKNPVQRALAQSALNSLDLDHASGPGFHEATDRAGGDLGTDQADRRPGLPSASEAAW